MRNLYTNERLFEDLFGFRREFNEMFNRILTGKPWGLELPDFQEDLQHYPCGRSVCGQGSQEVCLPRDTTGS